MPREGLRQEGAAAEDEKEPLQSAGSAASKRSRASRAWSRSETRSKRARLMGGSDPSRSAQRSQTRADAVASSKPRRANSAVGDWYLGMREA
jgi:hypothetical protein